ncbi:metallophosphoesterase [Caviibacterium pharyngocola]|uniref:Metallophosphoesterase n=1 Tax=Caviibacterium pharyngocola TaxID=28159 RepID=A0A2M8RX11_9PAST|nr:metallophosphoesterase [Caviibacterium pharyngocola]PJG83412.1 metallophosphoesterase [Caviibacterium pharyngocola]
MELRHYITFTVAVIALQLFLYCFNRTLYWLLSGKISHKVRRVIAIFTYFSANAIIFLTILRIQPMFRLSALILVILLFAALISAVFAVIFRLLKSRISIEKLNRTLRIAYPVALCALLGLSVYNAYTPKVIHHQITLDKPLAPLRIGVASDLHLGRFFGNAELDRLAEIMHAEHVDVILLPGDIMDDNVDEYLAQKMQPHLAKLRAPLGVYATLGNHDFFGYQREITQEIRKAGIRVLSDESAVIADRFVLIGRNDDLFAQRPTTAQLLKQVNTALPIFLLDHRPTEILEHANLPIDIQVSGHTHKGQIFPANLITRMLYRLDYGYEKINRSHFFVTSGYGFWGIPLRLGSQSEVVIIDVKGTQQ